MYRRVHEKLFPDVNYKEFIVTLQDVEKPNSVKKAFSDLTKDKRIEAMKEEMKFMRTNHVWDFVDLPLSRKKLGNKWVLKIKIKADGVIERYKDCLVAKGYTQYEGIDYENTFSSCEI